MRPLSAFPALAFASAGHFFSHVLTLLYPTVVIALEGRFGWSYGDLLSLATPGFVLYGLAALPAGWLGDRWGLERMMVVFFLGTGGAAIATGLADGPWQIALGLAAIGAFSAIYHPVGIAWMVRHAVNRGRAIAWNGIFGSVGVGSAALIAGALTEGFGWRAAFLVPGALCAATGIVLLLRVRGGAMAAPAEPHRADAAVSRAAVRRAFIVLSVTMLGTGLVGQVLQVALPKLFAERLPALTDGGLVGAGGFVTVVFLVSAAMQLTGGWLSDRYPQKPLYIVFWLAQAPVFLLAARLAEAPLVVAMALVAVLGSMSGTAENVILARFTPGRWRATAYGAKFVLAIGVAAAGVPMVGWLFDATGDFVALFMVLAGAAAMTGVAAFLLPGGGGAPARSLSAQPAE